ncbi:unsaturated rhamnogalacturonyl hydrolase [Natranaerovirga hydrolytica]|uniref:Unsaturated rhamnogalacturonyl hydrolase n=1 Tax=Natranaerovirga hydrolytica TaxID=680378 RepID=A0A4R1MCA4_9FIRM|nr:glycoside hydrolase family 88 protein [Natranaerovirga hydrolytica]TCK89150.1 unsaturated rhamnogalacturonyl hydrolase [Natranaerovirga hydrolytica]
MNSFLILMTLLYGSQTNVTNDKITDKAYIKSNNNTNEEKDNVRLYLDYIIDNSTPLKPYWNIERKIQSATEPNWNYIDGIMIKAILEMYYVTNERKYLDFAEYFIDFYINEDGTIKGYRKDEFNIDNINAGKVLFDLYDLTAKEKYRKAIDTLYSQLMDHPRTSRGNFWHKMIHPNQVWLDGLYMAQPFYMEYETKYNNNLNTLDIYNQILNVRKKMYDEEKKLYYHGYDESRQMHWSDHETGLSESFWGRSMGWYVMALVDVLDKMDKDTYPFEYNHIKRIFKEAIDGLLLYQHPSGMWYQVIDQGCRSGNYLETSVSSMISYAILKGVRLGLLPHSYTAYGLKAYNGVKDKYFKVYNDKLELGGICLVAWLGPGMRDGSYEYYISEPIVENDAKGVAPFFLAYTEIERLKNK